MNIKFLMTGLLGLATMTAVAQNSELNSAQNDFNKYESMRGNAAMAKLAISALDNAKGSIDKAAVHEKTATLPKTFAVKGAIYAALAVNDDKPESSATLFSTADAALKKAAELDTKGEFKKLISDANINLAQYSLNSGVKQYEAKKFDLAYKSFDYYRTVFPEDTTAIYYTGLAASNYNNYDAAITNYTKLLTTAYSQKKGVYSDITNFYLQKKTAADSAAALKTLTEAAEKFPSELQFNRFLIDLNLQMGKQKEVLDKIEKALVNDPKNKTYYQYAGILYTQIADDAINKAKASKVATVITEQNARRDEYLKKAEAAYKKILEIDPNDYDATLNLGYVLNIPAIEIYYAAGKIPVEKQKEYLAAEKKAAELFELAKPYVTKAAEMKPTDINALNNLRNYYIGTKNTAKASELKKQIEGLKDGGK